MRFLQVRAAGSLVMHPSDEVEDAGGGFLNGYAACMDVGDQIAVRVGVSGTWIVSEIR